MKTRRKRGLVAWSWVIPVAICGFAMIAILVASTGGSENGGGAPAAAERLDPLPVMFSLPDFSLTERSGQEVTLASLAGRVWIADFIFTTCPGPCPIMTRHMSQLQHDFADEGDLRLVTITVDPERDTPARLLKYARRHRAHPARWLFLTGDRPAIYDLSIKGFRLAAPRLPSSGDRSGHLIVHSTRFVLVDRQGRIRGYYQGTLSEDLRKLRADARRLLKEEPAP